MRVLVCPLESPGLLVHLQVLEAAVAIAEGDAGVRVRDPTHSFRGGGGRRDSVTWEQGL